MSTRHFKLTVIVFCFLFVAISVMDLKAEVTGDTGKIGFWLSNAGSLRLYAPSSNDSRQLQRVNIMAALSEDAVCDYTDDHNSVIESYQILTPTIADIEAEAIYDNSWADLPPDVTFKLHLYAWTNEAYVIVKYKVINDAPEALALYLGLVGLPRISGSYGGETDLYDATHQVSYSYRTGETPHAGLRLLSHEPFSYHVLDYVDYSPLDPSSDSATDSTRYHMTADPGFDASLVAGGEGSIYNLNAGVFTIAAGDSVSLTYAIVYGDSTAELFANADAAKDKYDVTVSVKQPVETAAPANFTLMQNYPNPFNPTTSIRFDLNQPAETELSIYNAQGELVKTIASGYFSAGSHIAFWNGSDKNGSVVASGIYFYRLKTGKTNVSKKMMLLR